ncbi:helix-turn-helix domain-containing protein [Parasutterella excrementihominis]|uniref:helix-turn-helix domain-containing protein n=1 Tax=Parasutterella excrementihominis TaxID=487175 RepID=UPI00242F362F|nr:LuxR C-terminal-related transcriptional regulator [Parasutterella excrementihominis]
MISFKNLSKPSDSSKPFPALPQCSRRSGITVQVWNIGTRNSSCSPTANGVASQGLLNQEISERLNISTRTVHTHRLNSYKKLDVHSTSDLAPIAALYRSRKITL